MKPRRLKSTRPHVRPRVGLFQTMLSALWLVMLCAFASRPVPAAQPSLGTRVFQDPRPPQVHRLDRGEPARPKPYERVTLHGSPKPLPPTAITGDWPSFLGPTHNAVSQETHLLNEWPQGGPKLVWELAKGNSFSSPAIQEDRLVFPHRVGDEVLVECLHPETGQSYWQFRFSTQYRDRYGYNNGPRSSPVICDDRVYVYGAEGDLYCLALTTGQLIWKRDLATEFHAQQDFFGVASTPLVEGDLLIISLGVPGGPCVAAFDRRTGRLVWGAGDTWGPGYASPVPATVHGRRRVFVFAGGDSKPPTGGLLSLDPSSGAVDFQFPWRSRSYESVNASCPVVVDNHVFISASYRAGGALLRIKPDFTHETVWTSRGVGTHWNTAVYKDGHLYAFDGRNEPDASLVCVELKTGKVVWRKVAEWEESVTVNDQKERLFMSILRGSLLSADGHFLCLGELGHLLWLDLTPQGYRELARTWLFAAKQTWALPVLSRGLLYVCQNAPDMLTKTRPRLLCYDLRAEGP